MDLLLDRMVAMEIRGVGEKDRLHSCFRLLWPDLKNGVKECMLSCTVMSHSLQSHGL